MASNEPDNSDALFDDFSLHRTRSTRAASLASVKCNLLNFFDTDQTILKPINLAPPSASTINIRRHSAHYCSLTAAGTNKFEDDTNKSSDKKDLEIELTDDSQPPPIPKRTFQGLLPHKSISDSSHKHLTDKTFDTIIERRLPKYSIESSNDSPLLKSISDNTAYDFDGMSIASSVFEDNKTVEFYSTDTGGGGLKKTLCNSTGSSCESNKISTDSGYASVSFENDRIFFGTSENFRSRFSSVDTMSDCLTPDSTNANSPLIKNLDSPFLQKSSSTNRTQEIDRINKMKNILNTNCLNDNKSLPAVPKRNGNKVPKIPPPQNRSRNSPPAPPARGINSGKVLNNSYPMNVLNRNDQQHYHHQRKIDNSSAGNKRTIGQMYERQDSTISSDSYSVSSPGYNSKSLDAPLLQHSVKINKTKSMRDKEFNDGGRFKYDKVMNQRQDSNLSSDSFSMTSSPGYNSKSQETPLLGTAIRITNSKLDRCLLEDIVNEVNESTSLDASPSKPGGLQTIVRFKRGSNVSVQHKILKPSSSDNNGHNYSGPIKFRSLNFKITKKQLMTLLLINVILLILTVVGVTIIETMYPRITFINQTVVKSVVVNDTEKQNNEFNPDTYNPCPGVCLPVIIPFCFGLSYNYTVYPNYIGHFGQPEAQAELQNFDSLSDVKCYNLIVLYLCSLFVPKCGPTGNTVPPCKILCEESMRRCGFFLDIFALDLPEYLTCDLFHDSPSADECVGMQQVKEEAQRAANPKCSGFMCDDNRCIPKAWRCDGHVDCKDQTDEAQCNACGKGSISCGKDRCMSQDDVCNGVVDCTYGQDERNCIRLSQKNGDVGKGVLEVYRASGKEWVPACISHWDTDISPSAICSSLGYNSVNSSNVTFKGMNLVAPLNQTNSIGLYKYKKSSLLKESAKCQFSGNYPIVELTCTNYECGRVKNKRHRMKTRVVGGKETTPGDWPFIAAILGGPAEVFYCAGVLIADQWVLTASHCVGNHTRRNKSDWTIQLGITRRLSHTYYGEKVKIKRVISHPLYNQNINHDNDIALFQLDHRVAFHDHLSPVCLPPDDMKEISPGTICTVIGWGLTEDRNGNPKGSTISYEPAINEVNVPVIERELCNDWLETLNVTNGMICAGYKEGGRDACQGDSGGPLLCKKPDNPDQWFVGGIVSWGILCAHPKLPGVYVNVPKYVPWIKEQMNKYSSKYSNYN